MSETTTPTDDDLVGYAKRLIATVIDRPNLFADGPHPNSLRKAHEALELLQSHGFTLTYDKSRNPYAPDQGGS